MPEAPLTRAEIDSRTGKTQPVQLTREEFAALPAADRMRAYRAGQTRQIFDDVQSAAEKRKADARATYLEQHPDHARFFTQESR